MLPAIFTLLKISYKSIYNSESKGSAYIGIKGFDFWGLLLAMPLLVIVLIYSEVAKGSELHLTLFFLLFPLGIVIINYLIVYQFDFPKTVTNILYFIRFPLSKLFRKQIAFICLFLSPTVLILASSILSLLIFDIPHLSLPVGDIIAILLAQYLFATCLTLIISGHIKKDHFFFFWNGFIRKRVVVIAFLIILILLYQMMQSDLDVITNIVLHSPGMFEMILFGLCMVTGLAYLVTN